MKEFYAASCMTQLKRARRAMKHSRLLKAAPAHAALVPRLSNDLRRLVQRPELGAIARGAGAATIMSVSPVAPPRDVYASAAKNAYFGVGKR
jgi:hypothetical protein